MSLDLIVYVTNEAVKVAKRKDPKFLNSWLVCRYKVALNKLTEIIMGDNQFTEEFDAEFTAVTRAICNFADQSNTLGWDEFEKINGLQAPETENPYPSPRVE